MTRDPRPTPIAAILDALAVLCMIGAIALLTGCGSAAQAALPFQTLPQSVSISIDASDGGTVTVGGDIWLDARSGSATADTDQQGQDIDAQVEASASVPISTGARP